MAELEKNTDLVKNALWCYGNMAAMYKSLAKMYEDTNEDEFLFKDGICDTVIKLAMDQKKIEGNPIFKECIFFIAILISTVRVKQLV